MIKLVCLIFINKEKDKLLILYLDLWGMRIELDMFILRRKIHMVGLYLFCC